MDGTTGVAAKWDNLVPALKKDPQIAEMMLGVSTDLIGHGLRL
jgi:hypothetical protein